MKLNKPTSKIMVALDYPSVEEATQLVKQLEESKPYLKVGMQLFYLGGPTFIEQLKDKGFPIFIDLKLHDIPNTVKGAAQSLTKLGVDMINVHCAGGHRMMEAALEGVDIEVGFSRNKFSPQVIGVTQLTSTSQEMMNQEIGIPGTINNGIRHYAMLAKRAGLHGVVASPLEVHLIKEECGDDFITVTPGIRPTNAQVDDQVRITTPAEAARLGTDYMVVGRAITQAQNPVSAYKSILNEIQEV